MATKRKSATLATPNLRIPVTGLVMGLIRSLPPYMVPSNALIDCMDVWINDGAVEVVRGWQPYEGTSTLPDTLGPVALIDQLPLLNGTIMQIFATPQDFYWRSAYGIYTMLTPTYAVGTVAVANGSPTVTGTNTLWTADNLTNGDRIKIEGTSWYGILDINYGTQVITLSTNYIGAGGSGLAYTGRMIYDGLQNDRWIAAVFKDTFLAACLVSPVQKWDGITATMQDLVAGLRSGGIFTFKRRPILVDTEESSIRYPQRIKWPEIGTIDDFTIAVGKEAGYLDLDEAPDWVLMGFTLGDYAAVYKERSIHLLSYVGIPYVFQRREVISGIGAISRRSVVNMGSEHIFMGNDDFYIFNGIDVESIGQEIRDEVFSYLDPARIDEILAFYREEDAIIEFIIPTTTGGFVAWMYHYGLSDSSKNIHPWTKRTLPATAVGYATQSEDWTWDKFDYAWASAGWSWTDKSLSALFPLNLFGDENGRIWDLGRSDDWNGAAISAFAEFGAVGGTYPDMSIEHLIKELKLVEPWTDLGLIGQKLNIAIGFSDRIGGSFVYGEAVPYELDQSSFPWVNFTQPGKTFSIKFSTSGQVGNRWRLAGYLAEVALGGRI